MDPAAAPDRDALLRGLLQGRAPLLGYLRVLTRDDGLAEDAFQDTMLVVMRKLEEFDTTRDFHAWVRGIGRHVCQRVLAKRQARPVSPTLLAALEAAYEERTTEDDGAEAANLTYLLRCLEKLGPAHRQLVQLRYAEGLNLEALGNRLGRTAGAVQVALSRVRRALSVCIEQQRTDLVDG